MRAHATRTAAYASAQSTRSTGARPSSSEAHIKAPARSQSTRKTQRRRRTLPRAKLRAAAFAEPASAIHV